MQAEYPGDFIFKGGTSLSRAYGLSERFSEDIDILVRERDEAKNARYRRIDAMTATAAGAVGNRYVAGKSVVQELRAVESRPLG